ncbi:MAG: hypothetical protein QOF35_1682 [Actinomycetota bacterium]|nr:hypothetical protein [Actinomycetota bacterium]
MLDQLLWSLALVLALTSVALILRVVSFHEASRRPVPVELQRSPVRGAQGR